MSPRKSSTSSGNRFERPRYLLVEVAGDPPLSPRALEGLLRERLGAEAPQLPFRILRTEGRFALVSVRHTDAPRFRASWNPTMPSGPARLRTLRTYGTLRKGKAWLARSHPPRGRTRADGGLNSGGRRTSTPGP